MKRKKRLIDQIASPDNMREAYRKTSKGKRGTYGCLEFKEYATVNLGLLREELLDGGYTIGEYRHFTVREPKVRLISALDFKDRLVQHALCNVVAPIMEASLLPYTFACRTGFGTHAGVRYVQSRLRRPDITHFLKTDYSKFFPSVNRNLAISMYGNKIACQRTMDILTEIIPPDGGCGIPIGSLTSQLTANLVGGIVDRYIHFDLQCRYWARYMDDIVILDNDTHRLRDQFGLIQQFSMDRLGMRISHWHANPVSHGVNFLGYRIWKDYKLLRKDSVIRAKRKVQRYVSRGEYDNLTKFMGSWSGHAQWADTCNLFNWMENRYGIAYH